jgi:hypothetical protein
MLHHVGISEQMFKKAALSQLQLKDSELQNEVAQLLNYLGKQDSGWSAWRFSQVIKDLDSYSLIEYNHQNRTYSIHPLVQHWGGTTMEENRHFMRKCVLSIIGLSISWMFNSEDYKYRRTLLQHISNSRSSLNPEEIPPSVLDRIALVYAEQGRWNEAETLEVAAMEKRKEVLGDDHPSTLESMGNLASTYWNQGRWGDAETLQVVVMEKMKKALGDDHPDTLTSMANLASTYWNQERWKEAETLDVVVMEKRKQVLGDDHPDTLASVANLCVHVREPGALGGRGARGGHG